MNNLYVCTQLMKIPLGYSYFDLKENKKVEVVMDTAKLVNPHALLVGGSGMGKSYTLIKMMQAATASDPAIRFHVFDVHGDLDVPGASVMTFSDQSPYGLNPLKINPNLEFGGVKNCIRAFITTLDTASRSRMGLKQEAIIRTLIEDVLLERGFDKDDPSTWDVNEYSSGLVSHGKDNRLYLEVPLSEKDSAKALGARWDPDKKHWWVPTHLYRGDICRWPLAFKERGYPSLNDVVNYARSIYVSKFIGSDQEGVRALIELNKKAQKAQKKMLESLKNKLITQYDEEFEEELEESKQKALEAYERFLNSIKTGQELDTVLKYKSPEMLSSIYDRLENLNATGIFKDQVPPFDESKSVYRYKLNALRPETKKMFVLFKLQELFLKAIERGIQSKVVDVIVLDELSSYTAGMDDKGDDIISIISREARKYGLALWSADQSLDYVPKSMITSVGTKIILGLDGTYWTAAQSKLIMEEKLLQWISPRNTIAVQLKEIGTTKNRWWWTALHDKVK